MTDDQGDYEVGYGKPPKQTRFKKGQSGNPKGRAKGSRNIFTELEEELSEPIQIREGGNKKIVSKSRAVIKALVAKALKGDTKAIAQIHALSHAATPEVGEAPNRQALDAEDMEILERIASRMTQPAPSHGGEDDE